MLLLACQKKEGKGEFYGDIAHCERWRKVMWGDIFVNTVFCVKPGL